MIASMLASKGLDLISGAIAGGADKAVDFVKEKTGIDLNAQKELSQADILQLKQLESQDRTRLEELAYKNKVEDNRHIESVYNAETKDRDGAREHDTKVQESENASWMAKNAAYYIDFLIILSTFGLATMLFFVDIPKDNIQIANIMFGTMLGLMTTIVSYHRGSSHGSKAKNDLIGKVK